MALDFDKVRALSTTEMCALALCELSRFVDALERIAPTPDAIEQAQADANAPVTCPHPAELRINVSVMGQEPFSTFRCGVCQETITQQPVEV